MKISIEPSDIKSLNRSRILRAFRENDIIQKKDLVDLLGLSITTVTTNTRHLLKEGYIEEMGIAESTGGRKPVVFKFLKNAKVSFGVDIAPHQVTLILTNLTTEILEQRKFTVDQTTMDQTAMDDILKKVTINVEEMLQTHGYLASDCLGVGISLPGIVDEEAKVLLHAPNLKDKMYDFKAFEKTLGLDVFIENEANVAAFAELILGSAQQIDHAVMVSITDGVGCGIIANHKVNKGTFKKAGEFGHMRISDRDIQCSCGRKGCWELFSSERALYKNYATLSGHSVSDLDAFFKLYEDGDDFASAALKRYLTDLFVGIENIMLGLDPEVIIVGGEIAQYLRELKFLEAKFMESHHSNVLLNMNKLVFSTLAPQSAVIGSSLLPFRTLFGY